LGKGKAMNMKLVDVISDRTLALLNNFERAILTANLEYILYGVPVWKHIYHALYWFDYWFAGPDKFCGAEFHEEGLQSLDIPSDKTLSKEQLLAYHKAVSEKTKDFLAGLTDDMLYEKTENQEDIRMQRILGQFCHVYNHIGIVHGSTIIETGKWPYIAAHARDITKGLFY